MSTELVLRKDVPNVGKLGDVIKVPEGFARNYLLPRGFAYRITSDNLKRLESEKKKYLKELEALKSRLREVASRLSGKTFRIEAKANEEGNLYGSVDAAKIAEVVAAAGFPIEAKGVRIPEPFKAVGAYEVDLQLHPEIEAKVKVEIAAEAASEEKADAAEGAPAAG
ncbi:MAG: 50S ribosomal protein L9 [Planctomycetes bacterium]|jgi:large subunit ribosomal protein L9|nr:50S ribosomal protein L9 [Planctomycetota bacterium]